MDWQQNNSRSKEILGAYFRQGLHELGSVAYGPGTAAQHPEYGMLGTKPASMIVEGLNSKATEPDRDEAAPSGMDAHLSAAKDRAEQTREPERDARDLERE